MTTPQSPAGRVTGIGSWPGTDAREAANVVTGELDSLPHLVELPARGLGADMIGRAAALLVDLPLDVSTTAYQVASHRGSVARRASDLLNQDLDALEETWESAGLRGSGRLVKVQSVGPLTLAANIELSTGRRVLTDSGAVRDFAESLTEGVSRHAAEVARRLGAPVLVQFDEPSLPAVLAGSLSGRSRFETVPAVPEPEALAVLDAAIAGAGPDVVVHCCAENLPADLLRRSGARAVSFDLSTVSSHDLDGIGELLDAGKDLVLGVVPTSVPGTSPTWRDCADPVVALVDRLGFPRTVLRTQVGVSPACGLAGASESWARPARRLAAGVGRA